MKSKRSSSHNRKSNLIAMIWLQHSATWKSRAKNKNKPNAGRKEWGRRNQQPKRFKSIKYRKELEQSLIVRGTRPSEYNIK
jgi:hypothetical protein